MASARVTFTSEAKEDLADLDGAAQKIVIKALAKLKTDPEKRGEPLGATVGTGNLTGLRKLVVGNRTYRIVYEVRADNTVVVVWVIGPRAEEKAYHLAVARIETYNADPTKKNLLKQLVDTAWM